MGIPRYFRYITSISTDITEEWSLNYEGLDVLYLDLNCLIHPVVREIVYTNECDFRKEAYQRIGYEIDKLWNLSRPKEMWVAIDGVAPRAKMEQQRRRRFKSSQERRIIAEVSKKYGNQGRRWDTNAISPGTSFMCELDIYLSKYLNKYEKTCLFRGSSYAGEGEHKIMEDLRSRPNKISALIYGLDADLIMLSSLQMRHNIYLLREAIAFGKPQRDRFIVFKVEAFRNNVCKDLLQRFDSLRIHGERPEDEEFIPNNYRLMVDYVFMCFLFGNDFLPHSYWLSLDEEGMELILKQYTMILANTAHYFVEIDNDGKVSEINYRSFGRLINGLYWREDELVKAKLSKWRDPSKQRYKFPDGTLEGDIERRTTYCPVSAPPVWNPIQYQWTHFRLYDETRNREYIRLICYDYLKMMVWNIRYYVEGVPSWTDYYRWTGSPLLKHLVAYLGRRQYMPTFDVSNCYTSDEQLAFIMPLDSLELVPEKYRKRIVDSGYCIGECKLDTFAHTMLYECEPLLPWVELCSPDRSLI